MLFLQTLFGLRRVTAKPSEFLVHIRRGTRVEANCRQGGSCVLWPGDSAAIIPTTLRSVAFKVSQVSRENAEVRVDGIAVYRIASPLVAYQMVDFSSPEEASAQIDRTLTDMCVAAVRRLVANMTLEDCLRRRKEGIAEELRREIVPIVSGLGATSDMAEQGWGIVIDTIDIHDVFIGSDEIFGQLQAPYRNELRTQDSLSRLAMEARVEGERRRNEAQRLATQLVQEEEMARLRLEQKKKLLAMEREAELESIQTGRELARHQMEAQVEQALDEHRAKETLARHEMEMAARLAELEAQRSAIRHRAQLQEIEDQVELEARRLTARLDAELRQARAKEAAAVIETDTARRRLEAEVAIERERRRIQNEWSESAIQAKLVGEALPEVARALGAQFGRIQVTQIGGPHADGFAPFLGAVSALGRVVEQFGFKAPESAPPPRGDDPDQDD